MTGKNIIIFGAPGSGKGTISNLLEEKFDIIHFSTGDILRREVEIKTELGNAIKKYTDSGKFVPDDVVVKVISNTILSKKYFIETKGFILDGFPRNINQAKILISTLEKLNIKLDSVVYLFVQNKQVLISRLNSRLICKRCEKNYNSIFSPSLNDGICDYCGGELYRRNDDNIDVIKNRIELYEKNLVELIKFFENKNIPIFKVNSNRDKKLIIEDILKYIKTL